MVIKWLGYIAMNPRDLFIDEILHDANVFITPGFIFGTNGERYVRISLCSDTNVLEEALTRISKVMNEKKATA